MAPAARSRTTAAHTGLLVGPQGSVAALASDVVVVAVAGVGALAAVAIVRSQRLPQARWGDSRGRVCARCAALAFARSRTARSGCVVQGMVSMSAEEDRANMKHKAALRARLEATTMHLLRVVVTQVDPMSRQPTEGTAASDADDARKARLSRLDGEASGQEPEPEPEPESEPEQGEGLRDSLSTEVAQMLLPYVPLISRLLGQQVRRSSTTVRCTLRPAYVLGLRVRRSCLRPGM